MGTVITTGILGVVAIALAAEALNIAMAFSELSHAAAYNAGLF